LPLTLACLLTALSPIPAQESPPPSATPLIQSSPTQVEWPRLFTELQFKAALQRVLDEATPGIVQSVLAEEIPKRAVAEAERDAALKQVAVEARARKKAEVLGWVALGGAVAGTIGGIAFGVWIAK
jgi:hypothetical protein